MIYDLLSILDCFISSIRITTGFVFFFIFRFHFSNISIKLQTAKMSLNASVTKHDLDDSKESFKPQPDDLEPSKSVASGVRASKVFELSFFFLLKSK